MVFLALGTNIGDRLHNIWTALEKISEFFEIKRMSHIIETEALLLPNSPDGWCLPFLNMVICGETSLEPLELLTHIQKIEWDMGRKADHEVWSPRTMDIDIISYNGQQSSNSKLTLPHPGVRDREYLQYLLREVGYDFGDVQQLNLDDYHPLNHFVAAPKFVGILNVTPDSFSDGGKYFDPDAAAERFHQLQADGACIVELGGQSTRPNYIEISADEEYARVSKVLEKIPAAAHIGIDSYFDEVVEQCLKNFENICWVNDIYGRLSDKVIKLIADHNLKLVAMLNGHDISILKTRIKKLQNLGISRENIVADPGIGFAKTKWENIKILKRLREVKDLGCEVMLAHSRKSFISVFSDANVKDRDLETIVVSLCCAEYVDYLRVHNLHDHMRAFVAAQCLE